jgi:O-antigen/teichoic acid export membrane protein
MQKLKDSAYRFLRWTEKYTKTDMVYLTHGGFWLTASHVLTVLANFFISVEFGLYFPKSSYGDYRYVLSIFAILSAFSLTGLSTAIVQAVARGFDNSLRQGFRLSFRWSAFMTIGGLIGSGYYFWHANVFLGSSLLIIAIISPFLNSWGLFASFISGKKDFKRLAIYNFIDNIIPAFCVLGTIFVTHNVLILVGVYFLSNTILGFFLYQRTLHIYKPNALVDHTLESYSKKLSLLNIIGIVTANIDKVIVYSYLGAVELAVYGIATAFPDQIRNILKNLNTLMVPKFTERSALGQDLALFRKIMQLAILVFALTIVYITVAPYLYAIFFPKYPESVFFSRVLALSIISALGMIPSSLFIAKKKSRELTNVSMVGSIFQIIVLIPTAKMWGLLGVCIARVLVSYINLGLAYWMLRSELRKNTDAPTDVAPDVAIPPNIS